MAFKLNRSVLKGTGEHKDMVFKMQRKELDNGIAGEANDDGTIFVNKDIPKGSPLEAEVVAHEGDHMARMEKGELGYSDDNVTWRGKKYDRKDGKIKYNGQWREEGWKQFPWEKLAYKVGSKAKKEAEKKNA
tara:strand:- start:795 stop:1190 length:396 start_codon:yes stop_codon:yes gene_type:complete